VSIVWVALPYAQPVSTGIDRDDPNHALAHAQEDLLIYFDHLPAEVQNVLNQAGVNVCSWCAGIWVEQYGAQAAVQLIRDVRFVDTGRAVTPVGGWEHVRL
jgi:hypothetical protein